jgi:hypothetical protein
LLVPPAVLVPELGVVGVTVPREAVRDPPAQSTAAAAGPAGRAQQQLSSGATPHAGLDDAQKI